MEAGVRKKNKIDDLVVISYDLFALLHLSLRHIRGVPKQEKMFICHTNNLILLCTA